MPNLDTAAIRQRWAGPGHRWAVHGHASAEIFLLCAEVERLRAENARLRGLLTPAVRAVNYLRSALRWKISGDWDGANERDELALLDDLALLLSEERSKLNG